MCLIVFAWKVIPEYPLLMLSNRDEFYQRPTQHAHQWQDYPEIFAGRDGQMGGTWLGLSSAGKIAAITNYRKPDTRQYDISRGQLTQQFLTGSTPAADYLHQIAQQPLSHAGFNLLLYENDELHYYSNRGDSNRGEQKAQTLAPGIYGLSNDLLDTPWPKVSSAKTEFTQLLRQTEKPLQAQPFIDLFRNESKAADKDLPDTGIGLDWERRLSSRFISEEIYGTRATTWLTLNLSGRVDFVEQNFDHGMMTERIEHSITVPGT